MPNYKREWAAIRLLNELEKGRRSAETERLYSPKEMREQFALSASHCSTALPKGEPRT